MKVTSKSVLRDLLGQARADEHNSVTTEKKGATQQKLKTDEHVHGRLGGDRMPGQDLQQPVIPSLQALQHLEKALKDGTAFRKHSTYRHVDNNRPEEPAVLKSASFNDFFYSRTGPRRIDNLSQVSFCKHTDLVINWDPLDPGNKNGSWRLSMKDYFRSPSEVEDHKTCHAPDLQQRSTVLAQRIIQKFTDMENARLSARDRRDGKEPCRAPPINLVEREICTMVSQMSRGKNEDLVEKREAARMKMEAQERRREEQAKTINQTLQETQPKEVINHIEDLEDDGDPVVKPKRVVRCSDAKGSTNLAISMPQEVNKKRKLMTAKKEDDFVATMHKEDVKTVERVNTTSKPSTIRDQDERAPKRIKISKPLEMKKASWEVEDGVQNVNIKAALKYSDSRGHEAKVNESKQPDRVLKQAKGAREKVDATRAALSLKKLKYTETEVVSGTVLDTQQSRCKKIKRALTVGELPETSEKRKTIETVEGDSENMQDERYPKKTKRAPIKKDLSGKAGQAFPPTPVSPPEHDPSITGESIESPAQQNTVLPTSPTSTSTCRKRKNEFSGTSNQKDGNPSVSFSPSWPIKEAKSARISPDVTASHKQPREMKTLNLMDGEEDEDLPQVPGQKNSGEKDVEAKGFGITNEEVRVLYEQMAYSS